MGILRAEVVGLKEALQKFDRIERSYGRRGERLGPVILRAARLLRNAVRAVAPVGKTGNLRRMMGASMAKRYWPGQPFGFMWAFAPHAHLVEYGHIQKPGGQHVPPHPFFRRGVESATPRVLKMIERETEKLLNEAVNR